MRRHTQLEDAEVRGLIAAGEITLAGHARHKIYGSLDCASGKRTMARVNRVFFASEDEAQQAGFRPCSACMKERYREWKARQLFGVPAVHLLAA